MKTTTTHTLALTTAMASLLLVPAQLEAVTLTNVSLELSLVVDVSGSVSASEYTLQMEGYASSFETSAFHSTVAAASNGIAVNLIQFASSAAESIAWTHITDATSSNAFAAQVRAANRLFGGGTNIDAGINQATTSINTNTYNGSRSVIDVSGDGSGADGTARDNALANGITTINGIVIDDPSGNLEQHYLDNVVGGQDSFVASADTFADFTPEVLKKLRREISGVTDDGFPVAAALRQVQVSIAQASLRDVNSRLFRLRTRRPAPAPAAVISSDKGSYSAKDAKSPIIVLPTLKRWEAFGSIHSYSEKIDGSSIQLPGTNALIPVLPDYKMDLYGGTAGIEYTLDRQWSIGAAFIGSNADVDMGNFGDIDIDGYALAIYASYYLENAFNGPGDLYVDALYSYGTYENDIKRPTFGGSAKGSTDSDSNTLALHTGYNLHNGSWIHGPTASLTWSNGDIDAFTEAGPGAVAYPAMDFKSLVSRFGYQVSKFIDSSRGSFIPQVRVAWEHEFQNDQVTVAGFPLGAPDEDRLVLGTGVAWLFSENGRAILNYEGRFSSDIESHQIGLRIGFKF